MKRFRIKIRTSVIVTVILTLSLLLSAVMVPCSVVTAEDTPVWSGNAVAPVTGGDGSSEEEAILITSAEELAYAVSNSGGKYYKLTTDIYLNDVSSADWKTNTGNNVWFSGVGFNGHLDGDGHIVYGVWYPDGHSGWTNGLLPFVSGGSVKNIGVCEAKVEGAHTGAITSMTTESSLKTFDSCFSDETVTVNGTNSAGGILGYAGEMTGGPEVTVKITNCYTKANITCANAANGNGIIGNAWLTAYSIENCYSTGSRPYYVGHHGNKTAAAWEYRDVDGGAYRDGKTTADFIKNVYTDTGDSDEFNCWNKLSGIADMCGNNAVSVMNGLDFKNTFVAVENATPKLRVFRDYVGENGNGFADGIGTESDPLVIENAEQLRKAISSNGKALHYVLKNDIYINDVSAEDWQNNSSNNSWLLDSSFSGHLDGNGHIVYGIWYPGGSTGAVGLIPNMTGGSIKNIGVCEAYIEGTYAGAIIGQTSGSALKAIDKCFSDHTVTVKGTNASGGIVGYAGDITGGPDITLAITNSYTIANIDCENALNGNGIIGNAWLTAYSIENCYSFGSMPYYVGHHGNKTSAAWEYRDADGGAYRDGRSVADFIKNVYTSTGSSDEFNLWTLFAKDGCFAGENAVSNLAGLDFAGVFKAETKAPPTLRVFKDYICDYEINTESDEDDDENDNYGENGGGNTVTFEKGTGTELDPYLIKNAQQLRLLAESKDTLGKYYKLIADIYVNDTTSANWKSNAPEAWYSHADASTAFSGYLEGDGHCIYGLYLNETPTPYTEGDWFRSGGAGLFPYINTTAVIRNVHIRDSYLSAVAYCGGIAGFVNGADTDTYAKMIGCSVDESVTIKGQTTGGLVGGGFRGLELGYSYSTAKISNSGPAEQLSALVGDIWSPDQKVFQCYSTGYKNYRDDSNVPAYVDVIYGTVKQNGTTVLSSAQMIGTNAKTNMTGLDWNYWYAVDGDTPHIKVIPKGVGITDEGVEGRVWSGKIAAKFAGGSGTKADPYVINTPEQLALLVSGGSEPDTYYKLTADIRLNDTSYSGWEKDARQWFAGWYVFSGHFDGNGHTVSGLYYNTEKVTYTALFPIMSEGSSVSRLGVINSTLINKGDEDNHTYAAAINALVSWEYNKKNGDKMPLFSQCFVDTTVKVEAYFAGGIACGCPAPLKMENCYSVAKVVGDEFTGGLVGNSWCDDVTIINSYCATADRDPIGDSLGFDPRGRFTDVYVDGPTEASIGVTKLSLIYMQGEKAKERMTGLDFENIWQTVDGGTPVLRCFADAENYTSKRDAQKIEISFASQGGSHCGSIYGYAGFTPITEEELPTPARAGYAFGGWYHFSDCTAPFSIEYFPDEDAVLYAKWIPLGFTVDFEKIIDPEYDVNEGAQRLAPGTTVYNPKYIHGGMASMYCMGDSAMAPVFLLSYENVLEIGKEYTMTFWMTTRGENNSGTVELIHANHPQVDSDAVGFETALRFSRATAGEWKQYTYTFVANAPYILIRTSQGTDMFFDDIEVIPTGNIGETGKLEGFPPSAVGSEPENGNLWLIVIIVSVVLIAVTVVTVVIVIRRRKNKTKGDVTV